MNISISKDVYIDGSYPANNYISSDKLMIKPESYSDVKRVLIKIPQEYLNSIRCELNLYALETQAVFYTFQPVLLLYRITAPWDESTVTWNNQPAHDAYVWSSITSASQTPPTGWYKFDITELSRKWLDGMYPNYGIKLAPPPNGTGINPHIFFASSRYLDLSKRPFLSVPSGLSFIDSLDMAIINDEKGNIGKQLDFSQIVAGNLSDIKAIDLYNCNSFSVSNPIVYLENLPSGDTIEISKFNNPFIPSPEVHFDGTFASGTKIGTFYVRVKPGEDSSGSKSFRIKAKATPV